VEAAALRARKSSRCENDANASRRACVSLGCVPAALLRPVHDKGDWRLVKLIEDRQVGAARISKHVLDAALDERLVDKLTAGQAGKTEVLLIVLI
jgi:hypothetical protein